MKNFPYKPNTDSDRKSILAELFYSLQSKITKISEASIISAIFTAIARLASKAEKDIAVYMARLFPMFSSGEHLDDTAELFGVHSRQGSTNSYTILKIYASQGTQYLQNTHTFKSISGVVFELISDYVVDNSGILFVLVRSVTQGSSSNVEPMTITNVSPKPVGHLLVLNESYSVGGYDQESDISLRSRIMSVPSLLSIGSLAYLEQAMIKLQPLVYKIYSNGQNEFGKIIIKILTWNSQPLSQNQLNELSEQIGPYLSLRDSQYFNLKNHSVHLSNIDYFYIDIVMKIQIESNANIEFVRRDMQSNIIKLISVDKLAQGSILQWEDIYVACLKTKGVIQIPSESFSWKNDFIFNKPHFPVLRGFVLYDLSGVLLANISTEIKQLYQSKTDNYFQKTVFS